MHELLFRSACIYLEYQLLCCFLFQNNEVLRIDPYYATWLLLISKWPGSKVSFKIVLNYDDMVVSEIHQLLKALFKYMKNDYFVGSANCNTCIGSTQPPTPHGISDCSSLLVNGLFWFCVQFGFLIYLSYSEIECDWICYQDYSAVTVLSESIFIINQHKNSICDVLTAKGTQR